MVSWCTSTTSPPIEVFPFFFLSCVQIFFSYINSCWLNSSHKQNNFSSQSNSKKVQKFNIYFLIIQINNKTQNVYKGKLDCDIMITVKIGIRAEKKGFFYFILHIFFLLFISYFYFFVLHHYFHKQTNGISYKKVSCLLLITIAVGVNSVAIGVAPAAIVKVSIYHVFAFKRNF